MFLDKKPENGEIPTWEDLEDNSRRYRPTDDELAQLRTGDIVEGYVVLTGNWYGKIESEKEYLRRDVENEVAEQVLSPFDAMHPITEYTYIELEPNYDVCLFGDDFLVKYTITI